MLLVLLAACTPSADLAFSPSALDFGEVDFAGEMPDAGYASEAVTLTNDGGATLTVWLAAYDTDHLCVSGFPEDLAYPAELGPLGPGDTYALDVGVCAYVSGEIGTPIATELVVETDGDPAVLTLPITFTPIRSSE
ncbi:MAG: hypothetical protein ACK4YP_28330 [Myxococcota bacterium]